MKKGYMRLEINFFSTWVAILKGYGIKGVSKLVECNFDDLLTFPLFLYLQTIHHIFTCIRFHDVGKYLPFSDCYAFHKNVSFINTPQIHYISKPLKLCLLGYVYF